MPVVFSDDSPAVISPPWRRRRKIWIADALRGAARRRRLALTDRGKAAIDIIAVDAIGLKADGKSGIVGLRPRGRAENRERRDRHDQPHEGAHPNLLFSKRTWDI